ncbi:MAG: phosphotransferase family protein [Candidatus Binatia bacterium]|nr:phosphotransferase family protein [Candidatus Binatia bacterium]
MTSNEVHDQLTEWLAAQQPGVDDLRIAGLDRVEFGHSAEMLALTLAWRADGVERRQDVVVRLRPPPPGLLEPYDMERQFQVLRALGETDVRSPGALWLEPTGDVLGRPFYVMQRLDGEVYEREVPDEIRAAPQRVRRMSENLVREIARIHQVDLAATGLADLGDGTEYLDRQLKHWASEIHRVKRGPVPGLERLHAELLESQPEPCPRVALVHGDTKPGNFAFVGDDVSAVFDWEMTDVGDPLADIGWAEVTWPLAGFTALPGALSGDELVTLYEELTGTMVRHREWYRAFQGFKMTVILFLGSMLVDSGASDDLRLASMGGVVPMFTDRALKELGIDEALDSGPVAPRDERLRAVKAKAGA